MNTPLEQLDYPRRCNACGDGPFLTAIELDEHITEDHISEAVWSFALDETEYFPEE